MKNCKKCNNIFDKSFFNKSNQTKDGLTFYCKSCISIKKADYYIRNREKIKQKSSEISKTDYAKEKRKERESSKEYKDRMKEYRSTEAYKNKIKERRHLIRQYQAKCRSKLEQKEKRRARQRKRITSDVDFKLARNLRKRLNMAIKKCQKSGSTVKDLGCSIPELKLYLESKFQPGMSWDNYGLYGWHIDHIIPLSSFNLSIREEFLKACNYTNLQPMWAVDNLIKGAKIYA